MNGWREKEQQLTCQTQKKSSHFARYVKKEGNEKYRREITAVD